jgi:hypothetical protein
MLVVAEDLVGGTGIDVRKGSTSLANRQDLVLESWNGNAPLFSSQPFAKGCYHCFGDGFTGPFRKFTRESIGFRVFNVNRHGFFLPPYFL